MTKTLDDNWTDWEGATFGFGYGTGEPHTVPALREFLAKCKPPDWGGESLVYDYREIEAELGGMAAWLLINILCRADILEYGSSARYGWLTDKGKALKSYVESKPTDELIALTLRTEDYTPCYPDVCNCGPDGYEKGRKCVNPFWR